MILTLIPSKFFKHLGLSDERNWRINTFLSPVLIIVFLSCINFSNNGVSFLGLKINGFCIFKKVFNLPCPVCGLTHSINSVLHLNIAESLHFHLLGFPIVIFLLILIFYRIITFFRLVPYLPLGNEMLFAKKIDSYFFSILVCFWVIDGLFLIKGGGVWQ